MQTVNDSNTRLHALQPDCPVPCTTTQPAEVKQVMDKVLAYLEPATPTGLVNNSIAVGWQA